MKQRLRVLVLGASGMLGHVVCREFAQHHEVYGTVRGSADGLARAGALGGARVCGGVEVTRFDTLVQILANSRPDVILNCIGVIKQAPEAKDPLVSLEVNALFPHRLARLAQVAEARLIHISTDCVFSGRNGSYRETDLPDAEDLYGRTKLLGELNEPGCLTLRTSIIGRELGKRFGLLEWFLNVPGSQVPGYVHAVFSGFTTGALARILLEVVERHPDLSGLYHVASAPISKYDLLVKLGAALRPDVEVVPEIKFRCDRTLNADRFRAETGTAPPDWDTMVAQLAAERPLEAELRSSCSKV